MKTLFFFFFLARKNIEENFRTWTCKFEWAFLFFLWCLGPWDCFHIIKGQIAGRII